MSDSRHQKVANRDGISVTAPARLHLGFIDLNGDAGRSFGSLGLGIEDLGVEITAVPYDEIEAVGPVADRAAGYARQLLEHHQLARGVRLQVHRSIPEHAGLGSGTQLALAVGMAVSRLYNLPSGPEEIAAILDRGTRSGIGIGTFMHGGFIVDAGRGAHTEVPPVVSRLHFPDSWRLVLIMDPARQGISGPPERQAFEDLAPMPAVTAQHISWLVLMQALPAIAESDCGRFGNAISRIQTFIGDYFAPVQGGRFYSEAVAAVVGDLEAAGASGVGQSSWGPTGFALFPSETQAHQALRRLRDGGRMLPGLDIRICRGRNRPAQIREGTATATANHHRLKSL